MNQFQNHTDFELIIDLIGVDEHTLETIYRQYFRFARIVNVESITPPIHSWPPTVTIPKRS